MLSRTPPLYMVAPGRCYRRDTPDATHSPIFLQVELDLQEDQRVVASGVSRWRALARPRGGVRDSIARI